MLLEFIYIIWGYVINKALFMVHMIGMIRVYEWKKETSTQSLWPGSNSTFSIAYTMNLTP